MSRDGARRYLFGLVGGATVVAPSWIKKSARRKEWIDEAPHLIREVPDRGEGLAGACGGAWSVESPVPIFLGCRVAVLDYVEAHEEGGKVAVTSGRRGKCKERGSSPAGRGSPGSSNDGSKYSSSYGLSPYAVAELVRLGGGEVEVVRVPCPGGGLDGSFQVAKTVLETALQTLGGGKGWVLVTTCLRAVDKAGEPAGAVAARAQAAVAAVAAQLSAVIQVVTAKWVLDCASTVTRLPYDSE